MLQIIVFHGLSDHEAKRILVKEKLIKGVIEIQEYL